MTKRDRFDWKAIHDQLDQRVAHLARTVDDDQQRKRQLLLARSKALATVAQSRQRKERTPLLTFSLGKETYAVPLASAREVVDQSYATPLPGAGPDIIGVTNWRGEFAILFDLATLLGVQRSLKRSEGHVIVLRGGEPLLALAVDSVNEIIHVDIEALQPPATLGAIREDLFRGATADAVLVLADTALRDRLTEDLQAA